MEGKKVFTRESRVYNSYIRKEEKDFILFFKKEGLKLNEFTIPSQKLEKKQQSKPKERRKTEKQNKYRNRTEGKISYNYSKR